MRTERRRHPRLAIPLDTLYRRQGETEWGVGRIANLSAGGAALRTAGALATGTLLEARFQLPRRDPGEPIQVAAVVLRAETVASAERFPHLAGLHFLDLEGERFERVREFVFRRLQRAR